MRKNLKYYKKVIKAMPESSPLKRELSSLHNELRDTIKESKHKHANQEYYQSRIETLYGAMRRSV